MLSWLRRTPAPVPAPRATAEGAGPSSVAAGVEPAVDAGGWPAWLDQLLRPGLPLPAGGAAAPERLIREARRGSRQAAERLIDSLIELDAQDQSAASALIASLVTMPELLRAWDAVVRRPASGPVAARADRIRDRVAASGGPAAVALASLHPDGRIREVAVGLMSAEPAPADPAFLALRTADWVPPVRDRARASLALILHEDPEQVLPLVVGMLPWLGRMRRGGFAAAQVELALHRAPAELLDRLIGEAARDTRRRLVELRVARRIDAPSVLVEVAERDHDPVVRLCAAEAAAREAVWTGQRGLLRRLALSRPPVVRVIGLTALIRTGDLGSAVEWLDDDAPQVRAIARDAAGRAGIDLVERYRDLVDDVPLPRPGALLGLAELGDEQDRARLATALACDDARVRAAAIRGLRLLGTFQELPGGWEGLDREGADPARLVSLLDDAPAVAREAVAALRPRAAVLPVDALWSRLTAAPGRHTRLGAYRLLVTGAPALRVRAAGTLAGDSDPGLAARGASDLARWSVPRRRGNPVPR